jgi:lipid-binding SYLF domain-containing protein
MLTMKHVVLALSLTVGGLPLAIAAADRASAAATADDLNRDAGDALQMLYRTNPFAQDLSKQARAILVFPNVVKAGLVFGGSYGEGVLRQGGRAIDYYNTASASWGLQAGAQSYGYALFLMNNSAVDYLRTSKGWEIGVGPTVVIVNEGAAKNLSTTTAKDDVYGFIFDQKGLMAGISIEGSKISRINR